MTNLIEPMSRIALSGRNLAESLSGMQLAFDRFTQAVGRMGLHQYSVKHAQLAVELAHAIRAGSLRHRAVKTARDELRRLRKLEARRYR